MDEAQDYILVVSSDDTRSFKRLDQFLVSKFPQVSRSLIKTYYEKGYIHSENYPKLELKKTPPAGTIIKVHLPELTEFTVIPENIPLHILYEDEHLIFINKPAGMVVHPAPGHWSGTLVHALCFHCPDIQSIGHERRPGIVHRLDKGTTGVMVAAKHQRCHEGLVKTFQDHNLTRQYQALIFNQPQKAAAGMIETFFARSSVNRLKMTSKASSGKKASTSYRTIEQGEKLSHLELTLHTGRTHQIRVHLQEQLLRPILNDALYGNPTQDRQMLTPTQKSLLSTYSHPLLHAKTLGLTHPITKKSLLIQSSPPSPFKELLNHL